jgi:hypothetical protein
MTPAAKLPPQLLLLPVADLELTSSPRSMYSKSGEKCERQCCKFAAGINDISCKKMAAVVHFDAIAIDSGKYNLNCK